MATRFDIAFDKTISYEGGYQKNPNDSGNYNDSGQLVGTKYGISAKSFDDFFGFPPTEEDMRAITLNEARDFYEVMYWNKYSLGTIPDQHTANHIFDILVNHGPKGAGSIIQPALRSAGQLLVMDNIFGPATRGSVVFALNNGKKSELNNYIVANRVDFFKSLVMTNNALNVFLNGWIKRAQKFLLSNESKVKSGLLIAILISAIVASYASNKQ